MAAAPRSMNDMTGALGFGVGLVNNIELVGTSPNVALKYWMHDNLAISPALNFNVTKNMGANTVWNFTPSVVALWVPWQSTATRLEVGGGIGLNVGKTPAGATDTTFGVILPIQGGVEHFFTRWLSAGIAASSTLFSYTKTGTPWQMAFQVNTAQLAGSLFFYTD
jgi:hypothetical protein